MPDEFQYLLLMAGCLAITLPLEFFFGARVYRRPRALILAVLATVLVFTVWDIMAIAAQLWSYSPRFTTGIMLPLGLPLEELVFFVVIPICGILTFEAVGNVLAGLRRRLHGRSVRAVQPVSGEDGHV